MGCPPVESKQESARFCGMNPHFVPPYPPAHVQYTGRFSRWHVHRGMLTYAATRVGAYLGEHRAPCVGVYVTRYAAASAAAYVGQDRRLHVWARVPLYASARVAAYLG